jgi:hypothetical protein
MIGLRFYVETKVAKRRMSVCASKGCAKCPLHFNSVPDECEHIMKHLLCTHEDGFHIRGRQTGKTTEIIKRAYEMVRIYEDVIVFVRNHMTAINLQRETMGSGIQFMAISSKQDIQRALMGLSSPHAIFTDELAEWVAKEVEENTTHYFVLGYYTP